MRAFEGRIKKRITPVRDGNKLFTSVISIPQPIKKRITPVRDGNCYAIKRRPNVDYFIKKRITPVRDGNFDYCVIYIDNSIQQIKKRITPVRDGNHTPNLYDTFL